MIRNGVVQITSRYRKDGKEHRGSGAHVHNYGTSVIMNELRSDTTDPRDCMLTIDETAPSITFEYVSGDKEGRRFIFEPKPHDPVGWDEMLKFAQQVQHNWLYYMHQFSLETKEPVKVRKPRRMLLWRR